MIDSLVRDLQVLWKADSLIGKIWVDVTARRICLLAFAGLIAAFGLGMADVAGFYGLQPIVGPASAAAIVAVIDFVLGLIVPLVAMRVGPSREIELALDVRSMAVAAIEADARDLKLTFEAFAQELRHAKQTVVELAHNPLDVAAQKLLIPAAISLIKGLHARRQEAK